MNLMMNLRTLTLPSLLVFTSACSSEADPDDGSGPGQADASVDMTAPDLGPPRGQCPDPLAFDEYAFDEPCEVQSDCGLVDPTSSCQSDFCPSTSGRDQCVYYECSEPLNQEDTVLGANIRFSASEVISQVSTFVLIALQKETSGGAELSCEDDFYALDDPLDFDFRGQCLNVLDARQTRRNAAMPEGETFTLSASQFPKGISVLFLIYGFDNTGASGEPIGVFCTEYDFPLGQDDVFLIGGLPGRLGMQAR